MLRKTKMRLIACKIEWHWLFIMHGRKKGNRIIEELLAKGQPLNSPQMLKLNRRLTSHCMKVSVLTEKYVAMDITQLSMQEKVVAEFV